ncbi:MAG: hypothetical protein HQL41_11315 [Alphaproteobacteria bacterium]|nr:hypothetical protein [Alphaproteobacteria bacterium]
MMTAQPSRPWPGRGLGLGDFRKASENGFGDPGNAYPHSMAWWRDRLFVGTTRSNMCMLKISKIKTNLAQWPVECPDYLYDLDMRAQIWSLDTATGQWDEAFRSPMITGRDGQRLPREMGYRNMTVFKGRSDPSEALYLCTYSPAKGIGTQILRLLDGKVPQPVPRPVEWGERVTTLRLLVPFKGRLFTSPTGEADGNPNSTSHMVIYETDDPVEGQWRRVCEPRFGDPDNSSVFEMAACGDWLYAGTSGAKGYQVWRTRAEGPAPYDWECVLSEGAWRGRENQGVASMWVFNDALYIGSGIQHGGIDIVNKVGPAGPELVRINADGSWDLLVGVARDTPHGRKRPLSGLMPGFGNFFNGYFWRMAAHDGWLYLGTFDWSLMLQYSKSENWNPAFRRAIDKIGLETMFHHQAGADLWRSADGENWLPVTMNGFDNPYNYGIRTLQSTPAGLFVGTVNPFAPRIAVKGLKGWEYRDNPRGGLEIWRGRTDWGSP